MRFSATQSSVSTLSRRFKYTPRGFVRFGSDVWSCHSLSVSCLTRELIVERSLYFTFELAVEAVPIPVPALELGEKL